MVGRVRYSRGGSRNTSEGEVKIVEEGRMSMSRYAELGAVVDRSLGDDGFGELPGLVETDNALDISL